MVFFKRKLFPFLGNNSFKKKEEVVFLYYRDKIHIKKQFD